jgi:hypothetical protein
LLRSASARPSSESISRYGSSLHNDEVDECALSREAWDKLSDSSKLLAENLLVKDSAARERGSSTQQSPWWRHRLALSQAITLAESQNLSRQEQAGWLLTYLLHQPLAQRRRQESFRLGIAGARIDGEISEHPDLVSRLVWFMSFVPHHAFRRLSILLPCRPRGVQELPEPASRRSSKRWVSTCWTARKRTRLRRTLLPQKRGFPER